MPSLDETYGKATTDLSLAELRKFLAWCRSRLGKTLPIIGGWAVYAYTPKLGSIDIDVVAGKHDERAIKAFFDENGYRSKEDEPSVYLKEIRAADDRAQTIHFDVLALDNEFIVRGIRLPWTLLNDHAEEIPFQGQKIRVPTKELLLIQKVAAYRTREDIARLGHFKWPAGERARLEGKIAKDQEDVKNLAKSGVDREKLAALLDRLGFKKVFDDSLREIGLQKE